jgi:hypothetical protein
MEVVGILRQSIKSEIKQVINRILYTSDFFPLCKWWPEKRNGPEKVTPIFDKPK